VQTDSFDHAAILLNLSSGHSLLIDFRLLDVSQIKVLQGNVFIRLQFHLSVLQFPGKLQLLLEVVCSHGMGPQESVAVPQLSINEHFLLGHEFLLTHILKVLVGKDRSLDVLHVHEDITGSFHKASEDLEGG